MTQAIVGVRTALPAFIGYTERATIGGRSVFGQAVRIGSLEEYETVFGGGFSPVKGGARFLLHDGMKLFFANGGGDCLVISVGHYGVPLSSAALVEGLDVAAEQVGPTMLVVPDAVLLPQRSDFQVLVQSMLQQCERLQDRVALLDVYGGDAVTPEDLDQLTGQFREDVGERGLCYGMAWFPFLHTTVVSPGAGSDVLPPSAAMAGVITSVDTTRGVWNAPANVALSAVSGPTLVLTDRQQEGINVPVDGKAINALRPFTGRGTVVWGARTLDGNSNDWRYIQVRRTIIYIEQSIKSALNGFVFAANDGNTWATVVSLVSSFLQGLWSQGALMGATASDAFSVRCGLGSTMTAQDILEGYMIVQVTLQMIRPAEFIELTFKQRMEGAG